MSQERLGAELGVTFQQVQKYEKGSNRMGASRLFGAAQVLNVPVGYFFSDMPDHVIQNSPAGPLNRPVSDTKAEVQDDLSALGKRETLELVRAYYQIKDGNVRKRLMAMIRAMVD